jgi:hypothetical protein
MAVTLAGVLVTVACVLTAPTFARAGTFTALTCHDSAGSAIGMRGWSVQTASAPYISFGSGCADGGAGSLGLTMGPYPGGSYDVNSGDTMIYSVPAGLTISRYSLDLYGYGEGCEVVNNGFGNECADGMGQVWVNHTGQSDPNYDYRNLGYGAVPATVSVSELSGVNDVAVGVSCDPGQRLSNECPGGAIVAQALISGGEFTLVDSTVPTVSNVSGSLISGGTLSGTNAINFTASDSGGGIYSAIVSIDGHAVVDEVPNNNEGLCANLAPPTSATMAFASPQPCPNTENISIPVDTTSLSAGQHQLQVLVQDAAGDQAVGYEGTITAAGPPRVTLNAGTISAGRGTPNGEPCAGETLELAVNGKTTPVIRYGKPITIRGVLHCGTVPVPNALIAVTTTVSGLSSAAVADTVETAPDGSFSYQLPAGPDRTLSFSYTAYSNDSEPSATASIAIQIRARIKLRIRPRHTRNRRTIHWTGTITAGPYPHSGVALVAEVKDGKNWKVFAQLVANSRGQFRFHYRFHATTEPTTYKFRVALPDTGARNYPYAPAASNTVEVHVNP